MTLDELYASYETFLQGYAYSLTRDADSAEDLVQETFMRSLGHLPLLGLLHAAERRAWLKRTLKNLFIDSERSRQRRERLVQELAITEESVEHDSFERVLVPNLLENLPDETRDLFEMHYTQGMNSSEIGQELGIPATTVRSRLHFALQKLQRYRSNWE